MADKEHDGNFQAILTNLLIYHVNLLIAGRTTRTKIVVNTISEFMAIILITQNYFKNQSMNLLIIS